MEFVPTVALNTFDQLLGIATGVHGLASGPDSSAAGWYLGATTIDGNSVNLITGMSTYIIGDNIGMAVDIGNNRLWMRLNGGLWNNNGSADPVGNVGGADISYMSPPFFVWVYGTNSGVETVNFGATAYAFAAPSGYGNW
jgi:hypothetical protein